MEGKNASTGRGLRGGELTPEEKKDIIAYVKSVTNGNNNLGGNDLDGYGP